MRLSYTRLLVENFSSCFVFYRDVMAFEVLWGEEGENYAEFSVGGDTRLALNQRSVQEDALGVSPPDTDAPTRDKFVLVFEVGAVDAQARELTERGATLVAEPTDRPAWGVRTAHLRDPEGNLIEINHALSH